jgi:transmembrane sensor
MNNSRFRYLYEQYLTGRLNTEELEEWKAALSHPDFYDELEVLVQSLWDRDDLPTPDYNTETAHTVYNKIIGGAVSGIAHESDKKIIKLWPHLAIAAVFIMIVVCAGLFFQAKSNRYVNQNTAKVGDLQPGKMGATLTLANGKKIRLDNAGSGEIAKESGVSVTKTSDGQLVYQLESSSDIRGTNTLSTARGENYILILPDKSKVWLNAASSVTYSADLLDHGIRRIQLEGEAYFEITKDKKHPFVVNTANHDIEVLGTHFNISSYADESTTTTTLVEGSVKVSKDDLSYTLQPNQQSQLISGLFNVKNVNAEDVVAWKDGLFLFEDETLKSIMKKISRWYNMEVEYAEGVDVHKLYGGGLSKYNHVSSVLEMLESTKNIHFKIEGRRILVMK